MALGAGAGAFEGDTAREQARLNRARLAEQQRQFDMKMEADQERLNLATFRDQRDFETNQQRYAEGLKLDERNFQEGKRQFDAVDRRAALKSEWDQVLAEETLKKQQAEFEQAESIYKQFQQAQLAEREQLSNRERMAKTGGAALLRLAYESPDGIVAKSAVDIFNKENGTNFVGAYLDKGTGIFSMDADDGNGNIVPNQMDPVKQETALRQIYGDSVAESFFKNRRQSGGENPQGEKVSDQHKLWKEKIETLYKAQEALRNSGIDTADVDKQIAALAKQTPGTRQEEPKPIQVEKLSGGRVKIEGRVFKMGDTIPSRDGIVRIWDGRKFVVVN
ncbi:MAG: hypothetical protein GX763_03050 [Clostridiaceae bacterium]|nr:hypothetical protein [Clostridiaceae bacterium]